MRRQALLVALLLAVGAVALAGALPRGGSGGTTVFDGGDIIATSVTVTTGGAVTLDGGLYSGVASGGTAVYLQSGARLSLNNGNGATIAWDGTRFAFDGGLAIPATSGSSVAQIQGASDIYISAGTNNDIVFMSNGTNEVGRIGHGASGGFVSATSFQTNNSSAKVMTSNIAAYVASAVDAGTNFTPNAPAGWVWIGGRSVATVPAAIAARPSIQAGDATLSSGAATVTFGTAYGATPYCACSDITAVAGAQCASSATQLVVTGTGSDHVQWICMGSL